jgi:preprotein translocase subunit SecY
MPRVRFEPTIPVFERAKTVHASGPAAAVIGYQYIYSYIKTWDQAVSKGNNREICNKIYYGLSVHALSQFLLYISLLSFFYIAWSQVLYSCSYADMDNLAAIS